MNRFEINKKTHDEAMRRAKETWVADLVDRRGVPAGQIVPRFNTFVISAPARARGQLARSGAWDIRHRWQDWERVYLEALAGKMREGARGASRCRSVEMMPRDEPPLPAGSGRDLAFQPAS